MTNYYFLTQLTGRDSHLRAGDADRERTAERLRTSHAEGRLDLAEFQERLERCYQAKTMGDLDELGRDLPRQERPNRHSFAWPALWRWPLVPLVGIVLMVLALSAAFGHHHVGWLWIPVVFLLWKMSWWRRRRWYSGPR